MNLSRSMRICRILPLLLALSLLLAFIPRLPETYAVIDISGMGWMRLEDLKTQPGVAWWVEAGDDLLVRASNEALEKLAGRYKVSRLDDVPVEDGRLHFAALDHGAVHLSNVHYRGLVMNGRYGIVWLVTDRLPTDHHGHRAELIPFRPNTVLARDIRNSPHAQVQSTRKVGVASLVEQVDPDRWFSDVSHLAGYNRWTYGDQIDEARNWLVARFQELPGLTVSTPQFQVSGEPAFNVMAVLEGTETPDDWYIVGAHYDAISQNSSAAAPGAEDNASGTAAVLELARIFAANPPKSTVIFLCYSGEEQGLHGSADHASDLVAGGQADMVKGVLIMDMIGYTSDDDFDILLESNLSGSFLFDLFTNAAQAYTDLRILTSLNPFGSDHIPYLNRGMDAVLTIENEYFNYPGYHRTTDLAENINVAQGGDVVRAHVAVLAELAGVDEVQMADFGTYIDKWGGPVEPPSVVDINGNSRVDVGELSDIVTNTIIDNR